MSKQSDLVTVARDAGASGYVNVTGDTMTGNLVVPYEVIDNNTEYSGMSIRNTRTSFSTSYVDSQNRNNSADSHIFFTHGTDGSSTIRFGTQPPGDFTDRRVDGRMVIDEAGRVLTPYQPAFVAVLNGTNQSVGVGNYPCSNALTNIGGHYNTATYRFTAPVSGLYHFVGGVYFNSGVIHPRVGIRINGAGTNGIMSQNYFDRNDNHLKISWIRYLSAGDYVEMYNDNGTYTVYGGGVWQHTFFSGYLIG
jgi:hypothetical protein